MLNQSQYEEALSALWARAHQAIKRDIYPNQTERRLGEISNRALNQVEGWPSDLKNFIWRKYGEGCMSQMTVEALEIDIDRVASMVTLRLLAVVRENPIP